MFFVPALKINEKHGTSDGTGSASCTFPLIGMLHSVMRETNALFVGRVQRVHGDVSEYATRSSCRHPPFILFPFFLATFRPLVVTRIVPLPSKISNHFFHPVISTDRCFTVLKSLFNGLIVFFLVSHKLIDYIV